MTVIVLAAILTVVVTAWLVHPLMKNGEKKKSLTVMIALPLCALVLYLWQGQPDLPSAPALFEQDGPRTTLRVLAKDELKLTQALSQDPGNENLQTQLGEVFYARGLAILAETGDREAAAAYLDNALSVAPKTAPYLKQLRADRDKIDVKNR